MVFNSFARIKEYKQGGCMKGGFITLNPAEISTTLEKWDVLIVYTKQGKYWVCDKKYTPRKLNDGRIKYKLATKD